MFCFAKLTCNSKKRNLLFNIIYKTSCGHFGSAAELIFCSADQYLDLCILCSEIWQSGSADTFLSEEDIAVVEGVNDWHADAS